MYFGQRGEREFYPEGEMGRKDESSEVEVRRYDKLKLTETNPADSKSRILLESATRDRETLIVLYELPGGGQPYVTWVARRDAPEDTFWGHYFDTLQEAQDDFEKRLGMSWF